MFTQTAAAYLHIYSPVAIFCASACSYLYLRCREEEWSHSAAAEQAHKNRAEQKAHTFQLTTEKAQRAKVQTAHFLI